MTAKNSELVTIVGVVKSILFYWERDGAVSSKSSIRKEQRTRIL